MLRDIITMLRLWKVRRDVFNLINQAAHDTFGKATSAYGGSPLATMKIVRACQIVDPNRSV